MRLIGFVLVVIGAIVLGTHGLGSMFREQPAEGDRVTETKGTSWVPAVVGGIAVTGGLLVLVTDGRRE